MIAPIDLRSLKSKELYWQCFVFFDSQMKICFDHIKTSSKFRKHKSESVDSRLGVAFDKADIKSKFKMTLRIHKISNSKRNSFCDWHSMNDRSIQCRQIGDYLANNWN